MKYKAFLVLGILAFMFGTAVLADYVEPTGSPTGINTPEVLKTQSGTIRMVEKIGVGNGSLRPIESLLAQGPYIGVTQNNIHYGTYSEKFVSQGASTFGNDLTVFFSGNNTLTNPNLDQYKNPIQNIKPLQVILSGKLSSAVAITLDPDLASSAPNNYSLDLKATSGTNGFNPTTNVGLGNSCNLYPPDFGLSVDDGGGCPAGMYLSMFKDIDVGKFTATSTNNMNGAVVAVCTGFDPSPAPTNTGACTGKTFTDLFRVSKKLPSSGNVCTYTAATTTSSYGSGNATPATFTGKNVKIRWYNGGSYDSSLDGQKTFTYGCGSGPWKVIVTDDYFQYAEATE